MVGQNPPDRPEHWFRHAVEPHADLAHDIVLPIDDVEGDEPAQDDHRDDDPHIDRQDEIDELQE